jgi:uncharacterized RDD family membrane protein YckC
MNGTSCGSPNLADAKHCGSCGSPLPVAAPLAPAVASPPPAPRAGVDRIIAGYRAAALGDRLIALILDTVLMLALFAVIGMWAGARWGGISTSGFDMTGTGALVTIALVVIVAFFYHWLCEGLLGLTLGKAVAGVRVINENGDPCGLGPSLIRNILRIIDGLVGYLVGYFIAIFSKLRQRLGDHLARTFVVEKELRGLHRALMVVLWIVLVAAGFAGAYFVHGRG